MKKLIILLVVLISGSTVFGQGMEQKIRAEKQKYFNEKLELSEDTKTAFWKLYDEYSQQKKDIRIEMSQNRLGLRKSTVSDKEAMDIINRELDLKQAMVSLEKEYVGKYGSVLSPTQIVTLYKAEDDFNKVVMQRLRQMRGRQGDGANRPGN